LAKSPRTLWSLMVIRGADKHVKHYRVSKRALIAVPALLLLAVTGCFVMLQLRSGFIIEELEQRIERQSREHAAAINRKEAQIRRLEESVGTLSSNSQAMKAQLRELFALESKLKHFIDTYGVEGPSDDDSSAADGSSLSSAPGDPHSLLPASVPAESMLAALDGEGPNYMQLSGMIDAMTRQMELSLEQAKRHKAAADAIPSGWPAGSRKLTSGFGYRADPFTGRSVLHAGIDLAGRTGDPVYAAGDGIVEEQSFDRSRGNYIVLTHRDGLKSVYMHLKRADVEEGEKVARGQTIGQLGSTGRSTGPHLHFEILEDDEAVNPIRYLRLIKED
jgi:murein DD-endopeptidase MepM/ murein hydrolase activator NlpD